MSDRYLLGCDECPSWADAAALSGRRLRELYRWAGPDKLFIHRNVDYSEIEAFFSGGIKPETFWKVGILMDDYKPTPNFITHPTMNELKHWWEHKNKKHKGEYHDQSCGSCKPE